MYRPNTVINTGGENDEEIINNNLSGDLTGDLTGDKKISGDNIKRMNVQIQKEAILNMMELGNKYKTKDISSRLGIKDSWSRELISLLVKDGKIEAYGKNRGRYYIKKREEN